MKTELKVEIDPHELVQVQDIAIPEMDAGLEKEHAIWASKTFSMRKNKFCAAKCFDNLSNKMSANETSCIDECAKNYTMAKDLFYKEHEAFASRLADMTAKGHDIFE